MLGNPVLPAILTPLAGLGIDITRELHQILNEVNQRLEEQYSFRRPYSMPHTGWTCFFDELGCAEVGGQQWERGNVRRGSRRYYRIRLRQCVPVLYWFVQAEYPSEEAARQHWNGFKALMQAREDIPALMNAGEQRVEAAAPVINIRCKACQSLNDESAKFCNQCGSAI